MNRFFLLYFPGCFDGEKLIGIYDDVIELKKAYNRVLADENEEYEIYLNNPNTELSIKEFDKRKQEFVDVDLQQL